MRQRGGNVTERRLVDGNVARSAAMTRSGRGIIQKPSRRAFSEGRPGPNHLSYKRQIEIKEVYGGEVEMGVGVPRGSRGARGRDETSANVIPHVRGSNRCGLERSPMGPERRESVELSAPSIRCPWVQTGVVAVPVRMTLARPSASGVVRTSMRSGAPERKTKCFATVAAVMMTSRTNTTVEGRYELQ